MKIKRLENKLKKIVKDLSALKSDLTFHRGDIPSYELKILGEMIERVNKALEVLNGNSNP